jgi:hypothetical protein
LSEVVSSFWLSGNWKGYQDFDNSWVAESELDNAQEAITRFYSSLSGKTRTRRGSGVRD